MAGGVNSDSRSLEQTPTWAVAIVCLGFVLISMLIEQAIHFLSKWFKKRRKISLGKALEKISLGKALEKIKEELMLLGFISLLLTAGQKSISQICISKGLAESFLPCSKEGFIAKNVTHKIEKLSLLGVGQHRKLLYLASDIPLRRSLARDDTAYDYCFKKGKVPMISQDGLHQLHIFIFVLAIFHVLSCFLIMALGSAKMKKWKAWEDETKTLDYQYSTDHSRFRYTRETTFGRRHMSFWSKTPILTWIVCFFRQFIRSVAKVDYLTLRRGFILAHFAPESKFEFQRYIKRSLRDDFSDVVSISPPLWLFAILFLLLMRNGWFTFIWLSFIPLIILLIVGTKLQAIITKMAMDIEEKNPVVQGAPVVNPNDQLFWFKRPRLILHLIHFSLFESAFQLAFFFWAWYEYGLKSCFNKRTIDVVFRVCLGVTVQILCSYVTLPLYALVTQMGTKMKSTIFDERIATSLKKWHQRAKRNLKGKQEFLPSKPTNSSEASSLVHLVQNHKSLIGPESLVHLEQFEPDLSTIEEHIDTPSSSFHSRLNINNDLDGEINGSTQEDETNGFNFSFHLSEQR